MSDAGLSGFNSDLVMKDNLNRTFTLHDDLCYFSERRATQIVVPEGFITDLASIPRALWITLPPIGRYDAAAVVHDYLYRFPNSVAGHGAAPADRGEADAILLEAMRASGVGWWTRSTVYSGVRVGGWAPWGHYRDLEKRGDGLLGLR